MADRQTLELFDMNNGRKEAVALIALHIMESNHLDVSECMPIALNQLGVSSVLLGQALPNIIITNKVVRMSVYYALWIRLRDGY